VKALNLFQYTCYRISCSFPPAQQRSYVVWGIHRCNPRDRPWIRGLFHVICV